MTTLLSNDVESDTCLFILDGQWYFNKICKQIKNIKIIGICRSNREDSYITNADILTSVLRDINHYKRSILFGHSLSAAYVITIIKYNIFTEYIIASPSRNLDILVPSDNTFIAVSEYEDRYEDLKYVANKIYKKQNHRFSAIASVLDFVKIYNI